MRFIYSANFFQVVLKFLEVTSVNFREFLPLKFETVQRIKTSKSCNTGQCHKAAYNTDMFSMQDLGNSFPEKVQSIQTTIGHSSRTNIVNFFDQMSINLASIH